MKLRRSAGNDCVRPSRSTTLGAVGFVVAALALAACTVSPSATNPSQSGSGGSTTTTKPPTPLTASVKTPPNGSPGTSPIRILFSSPLAKGWTPPTLSPTTTGAWSVTNGGREIVFQPDGAFPPSSSVSVNVPAGEPARNGTVLASAVEKTFTTAAGSTVRMQQILASLGYLPVTFTPASAAPETTQSEEQEAYQPPAGSFAWRWPGSMPGLQTHWLAGAFGPMTKGAIMSFQRVEGLPVNGQVTPALWQSLFQASLAGTQNPDGYSWADVVEGSPETLTLWHDGKVVLQANVNTGIPARPTYLGTYDVYLRYTYQIMKGTNPDGSHYADPVYWVSYFKGGDAIHGFVRASYGYPQSLGCVELPPATAKIVYPYTPRGTVVTVQT